MTSDKSDKIMGVKL